MTYLVPRLYDVQRGAVEIDGVDVRNLKLESLGDLIGVVTQETYLFHTTIRRNLLYGRPEATEEEPRRRGARREHLRPDRGAPGGVRHDRGRTRLQALGRREAAARDRPGHPEGSEDPDPDEATSSLDTTSERLVQSALVPLMHGPNHDRDRAPAVDDPVGGRDLRGGPGPHRRARDARRAPAAGGVYARLYEQQFRGGLVEAVTEDGVIMATGEVVRTGSG